MFSTQEVEAHELGSVVERGNDRDCVGDTIAKRASRADAMADAAFPIASAITRRAEVIASGSSAIAPSSERYIRRAGSTAAIAAR